jgi:hypothetical protein
MVRWIEVYFSREVAKELRRRKLLGFFCFFFAASRLRVRFHIFPSALMTARRWGRRRRRRLRMGWLGALAARVEDVSREGAKARRREGIKEVEIDLFSLPFLRDFA